MLETSPLQSSDGRRQIVQAAVGKQGRNKAQGYIIYVLTEFGTIDGGLRCGLARCRALKRGCVVVESGTLTSSLHVADELLLNGCCGGIWRIDRH